MSLQTLARSLWRWGHSGFEVVVGRETAVLTQAELLLLLQPQLLQHSSFSCVLSLLLGRSGELQLSGLLLTWMAAIVRGALLVQLAAAAQAECSYVVSPIIKASWANPQQTLAALRNPVAVIQSAWGLSTGKPCCCCCCCYRCCSCCMVLVLLALLQKARTRSQQLFQRSVAAPAKRLPLLLSSKSAATACAAEAAAVQQHEQIRQHVWSCMRRRCSSATVIFGAGRRSLLLLAAARPPSLCRDCRYLRCEEEGPHGPLRAAAAAAVAVSAAATITEAADNAAVTD